MGPFKSTDHGEYKFVSKVNGQFHKLTAVYLLFSKRQSLALTQLFVTTVISLGKHIIRQRADKEAKVRATLSRLTAYVRASPRDLLAPTRHS